MSKQREKRKQREARRMEKTEKVDRRAAFGCLAAFVLAIGILVFAVERITRPPSQKEMLVDMLKRTDGVKSKGVREVDIDINSEKGGYSGKGGLIKYENGDKVLVTVAHLFLEYHGKATYEILSGGQHAGWISAAIRPREINKKAAEDSPDRVVDILYCKVGDKTLLDPFPIPSLGKVSTAFEKLIAPQRIVSAADPARKAVLNSVADWDSYCPVFAADFASQPGESGSVYFGESDSRMFLLSGSLDEKGTISLFVPVLPMKISEKERPPPAEKK